MTSHIVRSELVVSKVVRLSLLMESSRRELETVRVIAHALRSALIYTAEVLTDFDIVQWVIPRAHQVFGLLPVGKREEVGLGIETAVWNGLVTFLARGIFDSRSRLLVIRTWNPNRIPSLDIALIDKVCLIAAHGLVLRLRTKLRLRIELVGCHGGHLMMRSREQAVRVAYSGVSWWWSILILIDLRIMILPLHLLLHVLMLLLMLLHVYWIGSDAFLALTRLARRQHHRVVSG